MDGRGHGTERSRRRPVPGCDVSTAGVVSWPDPVRPHTTGAVVKRRADSRPSAFASPRASWILAAGLLLHPLLPSPTAAQNAATDPGELGRIVARLVDGATAAPVSGALVILDAAGRRLVSDSAGTAVFLDVMPGSHELAVRRIGYADQTLVVDVGALSTAVVAVQLSTQAVAVAPLDVVIENRPRRLEDVGFYDRRAEGLGEFFDPKFVERWSVGTWADAGYFLRLLRDLTPRPSCAPVIFIDGRRALDGEIVVPASRSREQSMSALRTFDIGAVEVYSDGAGTPMFGLGGSGCGAMIAIWTNHWRGREQRSLGGGDLELCEPVEPDATSVEGEIRDEFTGVLLPGAHVIAVTHPPGRPRATEERDIVADRGGRYRVCDVPSDHALTLQVETADHRGIERQVELAGPLITFDLSIRLAGPGVVVGRVLDRSTGRPVATAEVSVAGTSARTQTDELGYFALEDVRPGDHTVEISHLGFEPVGEMVSIVADRTVDLHVELSADPIALEPLVVTALRDRRLELRGFYDRQTLGERLGQGVFFERADLEKRTLANVTGLFREIPGVEVRCSGSRNCRVGSSRLSGCVQMDVFINGSLALGLDRADPVGLDELVRPADIAALEVYPSASSVPAEFTGMTGRCGAIVIWTG